MKKLSSFITLLLLASVSFAEETNDGGLLPKVDKPIADTYEPLDGAGWNHRRSEELKTLREYQKQKKEASQSEYEAQRRKELESKIQAPEAGIQTGTPAPQIEESPDRITISDPD